LTPLATPSLFLEYEEVLKRPEQREVSNLSLADVDRVLGVLAVAIELVAVHMRWRPQLKDPNDELVLEAAVNGRADALVTYNVGDFRDVAPHFGVRIARPVDLLEELRS
jgi:predicted nucleic acid-binding protein